MQTRILALVAVVAGGVLLSTNAQALPSISIIWQANGTATVGSDTTPSITGSSTIVADIVLTTDVATLIGVFVTIEFDASELQVLSFKEITVNLPGMGNEFNPLLAGGTIDNVNGLVLNFDTQTLATGLAGGNTATLGSVTFHVVKPTGKPADIDVFASLQNPGVDSFEASGGASLTVGNFIGASVTPEPTSALLLAAGLVGLGYAGRRSIH